MRAANPIKEVRHIGLMGEELAAYLNTLQALEPRQFADVEKALHTLLPNIEGIELDVSDVGEVELRLKENGVAIPSRVVSEGTLRLLGLLGSERCRQRAIIGRVRGTGERRPPSANPVDLQNFLIPAVELGATQYIVTTHSPVLLDMIPDNSLFVAQRQGRSTQIFPFTHWGAPMAERRYRQKAGRPRRQASLYRNAFLEVTLMREIALFVEDLAHQRVIGALTERMVAAYAIPARLDWISAEGGHGRVIQELRAYLRDLARHGNPVPDLIIAATDANCSGLNQRIREINEAAESDTFFPPIIPAVPDPAYRTLASAGRRCLQSHTGPRVRRARAEM